jgi:hypothetical protein
MGAAETMGVERIQKPSGGSTIEPQLDPAWPELVQLRWHAAVVSLDTGLDVAVGQSNMRVGRFGQWFAVPGEFDVTFPNGVAMVGGFHAAWSWLNGFRVGAQQQRRRAVS